MLLEYINKPTINNIATTIVVITVTIIPNINFIIFHIIENMNDIKVKINI